MNAFVIILLFTYISYSQGQIGLIGTALAGFGPCDKGAVYMEHESGRPPSLDNYWDGTIYPDKVGQGNLVEFRVEMVLNAPASIIVDEEDAYVYHGDNGFYISYYHLPNRERLKFRVQGKKGKLFPNIVSLTLNGADICPNPRQWNYQSINVGSSADSDNQNRVDPSSCGRQIIKHTPLIVNGFPSEPGEWPWHVGLYYRTNLNRIEYKCGGTLISNDTVITAAHCVTINSRTIVPETVIIRLGQHDRVEIGSNTQEFRVHRIIPHEEYNIRDLTHDVALLKLGTQATYNNYVQPICLWPNDSPTLDEVVGENGVVVGWGLNEKDQPANILTQARMPVVSLTECLESNRDVFGSLLSETNYCAGFRNGTSVCNGDSGGGMFFKRDGRYHIRGLVSVSTSQENKAVCDPKEFVIFTDVGKYVKWIRSKMFS